MVTKTKPDTPAKVTNRQSRPASTPDGREKQLVNLAVELAEKQLRDGSASAAVITHYLKLGTEKEKLERQILINQSQLIQAKAENIGKDHQMERLITEATEAMKTYAPK